MTISTHTDTHTHTSISSTYFIKFNIIAPMYNYAVDLYCILYHYMYTCTTIYYCCSDGGIEEMVNEMSNGKMLYGYLKVIDPNTLLPKSVLVNWVCYNVVLFNWSNLFYRVEEMFPPL